MNNKMRLIIYNHIIMATFMILHDFVYTNTDCKHNNYYNTDFHNGNAINVVNYTSISITVGEI